MGKHQPNWQAAIDLMPMLVSIASQFAVKYPFIGTCEDFLQEIMIAAALAANRYDPRLGSLTTFLHHRATGACRDFVRQQIPGKRHAHEAPRRSEYDSTHIEAIAAPDHTPLLREEIDAADAIKRISNPINRHIIRRRMDGWRNVEIAAELGLTDCAICNRVRKMAGDQDFLNEIFTEKGSA